MKPHNQTIRVSTCAVTQVAFLKTVYFIVVDCVSFFRIFEQLLSVVITKDVAKRLKRQKRKHEVVYDLKKEMSKNYRRCDFGLFFE
jgi:hypothetical protein